MNESPPLYREVRIGPLALPGNIFLAPVAGYSDRAFRSLCVEYGASFTYTEMVSSEALTRGSGKTEDLIRRADNETAYAIQIFGGDPARMAGAARIVLDLAKPECIDINAGCPVPKVVKTGAGSTLTRDADRLGGIVLAVVRESSPVPVTVKIRSGWDDASLSWEAAARAALEAGAAAITLHPRTRAQGYEGKSRWDILTSLCELVRADFPGIPVFGSGDLFSPESAREMLTQTGCDGVMFARGAMGNPFIFRQTRDLLVNGSYDEVPAAERIAAGWRELATLSLDMGELRAAREMRKRFCAYSRGIEGGAELREEIVKASSIEDYCKIFRARGLLA